ncbi:hypothetical protein [Kribbella solani]|uniref:hypothetical protein n=1 Tax=Kribbella solani TaxID=236067 RepID=UPI0029AD7C94|nr:hypothetical protein [Kribbella solani]MDX2974297.1 hypothetical protein [Kribbella solani]
MEWSGDSEQWSKSDELFGREFPKAFAVIYLQEQMSRDVGDRIIERVREVAQSQSFAIAEIFVEHLDANPYGMAYRAMLGILRSRKAKILITPGVDHFSDLDKGPLFILNEISDLGVTVMIPGNVE